MKIYICGNRTGDENRIGEFERAERLLREAGYKPCNPCKFTWDKPDGKKVARMLLRFMLMCEGVALLPDWSKSEGGRLEVWVAHSVGLPVKKIEEWINERI